MLGVAVVLLQSTLLSTSIACPSVIRAYNNRELCGLVIESSDVEGRECTVNNSALLSNANS
eukprot:1630026-Alexandrium_andersonii.AAC.1